MASLKIGEIKWIRNYPTQFAIEIDNCTYTGIIKFIHGRGCFQVIFDNKSIIKHSDYKIIRTRVLFSWKEEQESSVPASWLPGAQRSFKRLGS